MLATNYHLFPPRSPKILNLNPDTQQLVYLKISGASKSSGWGFVSETKAMSYGTKIKSKCFAKLSCWKKKSFLNWAEHVVAFLK
jgi:hypothetical protein